MKSKALLFGLNYAHTTDAKLNGCINDVVNMASYLKNVLKISNIECYTDDTDLINTSAQGMVQKLYQCAVDSFKEDLDFVWIHYSGHGTYVMDTSGDEADGRDECLVPSDFKKAGVVSDDYIQSLMRYFNPKTRVILVWDCCHSATLGDLKYSWESPRRVAVENIMCGVSSRTISISGCLDRQTSADAFINGQYAGAMTSCLLNVLQTRPTTLKDVFALLTALRDKLKTSGFTQVPKLCSTHNLAKDPLFIPF
jgi:hypothetical protein